jgi:hypothetical protein
MKQLGFKGKKKPSPESGIALVVVIIFITVIGFLGVVVSFLFSSGAAMTTDHLLSSRVFSTAEGGLERGIRRYQEDGAYGGESGGVSLEGQTYPFTINFFPTDFSGNPLPTLQRRFRSTSTLQGIQRITEQIVQRDPVFSRFAIASPGGPSIGASPNWSCGMPPCPGTPPYTGSIAPPLVQVPGGGDLTISNGSSRDFSGALGGTIYEYNACHIGNHVTINRTGTGAVTIRCKILSIDSNGTINNSGSASSFLFIVEGDVSIGSQTSFKGALYAGGSVVILSQFSLVGAVAGGNVSIGSQSTLTFEPQAGSLSPFFEKTGGIISYEGWREVFQ